LGLFKHKKGIIRRDATDGAFSVCF